MREMQVMLNEIRTRFGPDLDWSAHIAQAERLFEGKDRHGLTTLYDMMTGGYLPWTPENVQKLEKARLAK
jgi:hypothetical protein